MGRKRKNDPQSDLVADRQVCPAAVFEIPRMLQYCPAGESEKWQVERFDLLVAEFSLRAASRQEAETLVQTFHEFAKSRHPSQWLFARRLFGVMPVVPPDNAHPDEMLVLSREELCGQYHLTPEQLKSELEILRAAWGEFIKTSERVEGETTNNQHPTFNIESERTELPLGDKILARYGFPDSFFEVLVYDREAKADKPRPAEENRVEKEWLIGRLQSPDWQKMLDDPRGGELARAALINEINQRRLQREMAQYSPGHPRFKELHNLRMDLERQCREQFDQLESKFPEMAMAGRQSFRAVISDLNLAHRNYYGHNDRRLWDKVHTAAEIQFLLRQSVQLPNARYRLGWTLAVVEAMHGLYDSNFRSQLRKQDLKKLDLGFKRGVEEARRETSEPLVNLESGIMPGEGDDFADFSTGEIKQG